MRRERGRLSSPARRDGHREDPPPTHTRARAAPPPHATGPSVAQGDVAVVSGVAGEPRHQGRHRGALHGALMTTGPRAMEAKATHEACCQPAWLHFKTIRIGCSSYPQSETIGAGETDDSIMMISDDVMQRVSVSGGTRAPLFFHLGLGRRAEGRRQLPPSTPKVMHRFGPGRACTDRSIHGPVGHEMIDRSILIRLPRLPS